MLKETTDAVEILHDLIRDDREAQEMLDAARINVQIAKMIYDARKEAKISKQELADLIGTKPQVITLLEDAAYEGNSFNLLQKIGKALNKQIDIRFFSHELEKV